MKNVYLYDGAYSFDILEDGKLIDNRFFMANKKIQNIKSFFNQFIFILNLKNYLNIGDLYGINVA